MCQGNHSLPPHAPHDSYLTRKKVRKARGMFKECDIRRKIFIEIGQLHDTPFEH